MKSKQIELAENKVLVGGATGYAEERETITWKFVSKTIPQVDPDPALNIYTLTFADNNKELIYQGTVDVTIDGFATMPNGAIFSIANDSQSDPSATIKFIYEGQTVFIDKGRSVLVTVVNGHPRVWYDYYAQNTQLSLTGDGVTQTFNLSENPLLSDFAIVWVDGVCKVPTVDYTVNPAASEITFAVPPANGSAIEIVFDRRQGISVRLPVGYRNGLKVSTLPPDDVVIDPGIIVTPSGSQLESDRSYIINKATISETNGFYPSVEVNKFYCVFLCYNQSYGNFIRIEHSSVPSEVQTPIEDYAYLGLVYVDDTGNLISLINPMTSDDYAWLGNPVKIFEGVDIPQYGQTGVLLNASNFRLPAGMNVKAKCRLRGSTNYNFNNIILTPVNSTEASYTFLQMFATKVTTQGQIFENITDIIPFSTSEGFYLNQGNIDTTAYVSGIDPQTGGITEITVTNTVYGLTSVDITIVGDGYGATATAHLSTDAEGRKYLAPGTSSIIIQTAGAHYSAEHTGVKIIEHGAAASLNSFEIDFVALKAEPIVIDE